MSTLAARLAEPDLAGLPDWQAADALNAPDPANGTRRRDVPTHEARALLLATGEWAAIEMLSRMTPAPGSPEAQAATQQMVAGLQAAGALSSGTAAALLALAEATITVPAGASRIVQYGSVSVTSLTYTQAGG